MDLMKIYRKLLESFGPQDWWPVSGGFEPPEWEVCIGAILTQNTNWKNVERALANLRREGVLSLAGILRTENAGLEDLVRPSGYYRQKAGRLKTFAGFVLGFGDFERFSKNVTREQLLKVRGLGPETVDSIILYALGRPVFVIDSYTKRVFNRLGLDGKKGYEEWRAFFEDGLPKDLNIYREFHALIVELCKNCCRAKPGCHECPLRGFCDYFNTEK